MASPPCPSGLVGDGAQHRRSASGRQPFKGVGGGLGVAVAPGCQHDLAVGRQELRSQGRIVTGGVERPVDAGCGGPDPSLGEAEERQSRLRIPSGCMRLAVRVLGRSVLAPKPVHLAQFVVGHAERRMRGIAQPHRRPFDLRGRRHPLAHDP